MQYKLCTHKCREAEFFNEGPVLTVDSNNYPQIICIDNNKQVILSQFVKEGKYHNAKEILESLLDTFDSSTKTDIENGKCYIFSLFTTIIQAINSTLLGDLWLSENFTKLYKDFFQSGDISSMKKVLFNIIEHSCKELEKRKKSHNIKLLENIIDYVEENIADPNMYLPSIADNLSVNKNYLSNFFKEQKRLGLTEYIREKRIDLSTQLIKKGLPFKEIYIKAGFSNIVTFNRAFKKILKVTPSQYREEIKN